MSPKVANVSQENSEKSKQPKLMDFGRRSESQRANVSFNPAKTSEEIGEERSQNSMVDEILAVATSIKSDLVNIQEDIKDCTERVTQAELRISSNKDEDEILQAKLSTMESKQKALEDKVMYLETRSRRNNVRLKNLA